MSKPTKFSAFGHSLRTLLAVMLYWICRPRLAACLVLSVINSAAMSQSDAVLGPFSKNDFATQVTFSVPRYMPCLEELETVAACLILEAASEGDEGMRGVMSVIRNRAHGLPELFKPVVLKPMQFSALNGVTAGREEISHCVWRAKNDRMWSTAFSLVKEAQGESWRDITGGATHYTRSDETVRWTRTLRKTATIKHHSFYR